MHPYLGDFAVGQTVHLALNTSDLGAAPITLDTSTFRVYRDDGDTEDDSGITPDIDSDGRTGFHRVAIDTSADATFYAAAHEFFVVITVGTVDSVSVVGKCVAHFSIDNRYDALTDTVADSIPSAGTRPSVAQAAYMTTQALTNAATIGTVFRVRKPGGTTLFDCDLDSATDPSDIERV